MSGATINNVNAGFVCGTVVTFKASAHGQKTYYDLVLKAGSTSYNGKQYDNVLSVSVPEQTMDPDTLASLPAGTKVMIQYELRGGKDGAFTKPSATKIDFFHAGSSEGMPF